MSRAEQLRGKLFGGANKKSDDVPASRSSADVPLTIQIPKPPPAQPAPPKNKPDSSPRPPGSQRSDRCLRERLIEKLGADYHGAERYRLVQDGKKELHWKQWGPYLSDRQWVSVFVA